MKTLPVFLSERAIADVERIRKYILYKSKLPLVANGYTDRLKLFCARVGDVPHAGFPYRKLGPDIRGMVFERHYIVIYRISEDAVTIQRILSPRRNLKQLER